MEFLKEASLPHRAAAAAARAEALSKAVVTQLGPAEALSRDHDVPQLRSASSEPQERSQPTSVHPSQTSYAMEVDFVIDSIIDEIMPT